METIDREFVSCVSPTAGRNGAGYLPCQGLPVDLLGNSKEDFLHHVDLGFLGIDLYGHKTQVFGYSFYVEEQRGPDAIFQGYGKLDGGSPVTYESVKIFSFDKLHPGEVRD